MQILQVIDEKNYTDEMPVLEKHTVRALIKKDGLYAMQKGAFGEYKIPGGGVERGETYLEALCREVREETGLLVDVSTVQELGEILELREDLHCRGQKYVCHAMYYRCEVLPGLVPLEMTDSERREGFYPVWTSLKNVIAANRARYKEGWRLRDTRFLELAQEGKVKL